MAPILILMGTNITMTHMPPFHEFPSDHLCTKALKISLFEENAARTSPQGLTSCRGAATDKAVRRVYSLDGLLPASRFGIQQEVERAKRWINRCFDPLSKYQALMTLKETNRDAFYGLLVQNVETYLPIVYTPTGELHLIC